MRSAVGIDQQLLALQSHISPVSMFLYGAGAAVITYVCVVVLLAIELLSIENGMFAGMSQRAFVFGTLGDFYGSHLGAGIDASLGVANVGWMPTFVYYLFPVAILVYAGRRCATASPSAETATVALLQGASIVLGYVVFVLVSLAFLALLTPLGPLGFRPWQVVLVAGVLYPVVFGALGGYTTTLDRPVGKTD